MYSSGKLQKSSLLSLQNKSRKSICNVTIQRSIGAAEFCILDPMERGLCMHCPERMQVAIVTDFGIKVRLSLFEIYSG